MQPKAGHTYSRRISAVVSIVGDQIRCKWTEVILFPVHGSVELFAWSPRRQTIGGTIVPEYFITKQHTGRAGRTTFCFLLRQVRKKGLCVGICWVINQMFESPSISTRSLLKPSEREIVQIHFLGECDPLRALKLRWMNEQYKNAFFIAGPRLLLQ